MLSRWKSRDFHVFSWLVFIILGICPDALGEKPLLFPTVDELLIQEGDQLRIECYSEQTRLQFSFPKYTFSSPRSPHEILPPENRNGTWTFLRRNAVSLDTGWYACAAEHVEIENHFKILNHTQDNIAWIYVYVNSSEPFADRYYISPKMITILNDSPGIVPCRPTSPDLVVQLWKNFRIIDSNEQTSYDPKIGFIVKPPSRWNSKSVFHCKINGIEDEYILQYPNVKSRRPEMNPTSDELILRIGDELRIECYGETDIEFQFLGYDGISMGNMYPSSYELHRGENGKRILLRKEVLPGDTGWYMCEKLGIKVPETFFYMDYASTEINWIYVYVESSTPELLPHPGVLRLEDLSSSILVPCRLTSPSFNVSLKSGSKVGIIKGDRAILTLDENVRFDPRNGFYVRRAPRRKSFCYQCVVHSNSSSKICFERNYMIDHIYFNGSASAHASVGLLGQGVKWIINDLSYFTFSGFSRVGKELSLAEILDREKYDFDMPITNEHDSSWVIIIHNLTFEDAGIYTVDFKFLNELQMSVGLNITLDIEGPPTVSMQNESEGYFTPPGAVFRIYSKIKGSPRSNLTWTFTKYPNFPSYEDSDSMIISNHTEVFGDKYTAFSNLTMSTDMFGDLTCMACNFFNCSESSKLIFLSDEIGRFGIIGPLEQVYIGDNVTLTCVGSIYEFRNLSWYDESDESFKIANQDSFNIEQNKTQYSIRRVLSIKTVARYHQKSFTCLGETITGNTRRTMYFLNLKTPEKPSIFETNLRRMHITLKPEKNDSKSHQLFCCAHGKPIPIVSWFKDDIQLNNTPEYEILPGRCMLVVHLDSPKKKSGRYTCRAENRFGQAEDYLDLKIEDIEERDVGVLPPTTAAIFILILALIAWLVIRKRRAKMSRLRLQEEILKRFEEGALDYMDPNLDVTDQAEVLPYDEIWEYPRDSLKFGKILGSGAFGIVRKAEAKAIRPGESFTTVAVKMVRATSTLHQMTALSRELKILVHLGQHVNIINLLGACTKNISYGELFVIVEFCRFGNLKDYLSRRRTDFIDQVDPVTGEINAPNLSIDNVSVEDNGSGANLSVDCDSVCVTEGSFRSQDSTDTEAEDISCEASVELALRSGYDGDYTDNILVPLRTKDLLCWAWQVSRGMRFLGARKVVHGDLAARNILLADNNVVKICDLGLAKAILNQDYYNKEEEEPLPVKWMAIEALRDRRFSIESDVWSFGIVLWEFFTLAQSPYPEIYAGHIYKKLVDGYRLDRPKYAPKNMYRLMMNCWEAEPSERPSFKLIETLIHELLDDSVKGDYLDSGNEYCSYMKSVKKDYLTMDPSQYKAVPPSVELREIISSSAMTDGSDGKPSTSDTNGTLI